MERFIPLMTQSSPSRRATVVRSRRLPGGTGSTNAKSAAVIGGLGRYSRGEPSPALPCSVSPTLMNTLLGVVGTLAEILCLLLLRSSAEDPVNEGVVNEVGGTDAPIGDGELFDHEHGLHVAEAQAAVIRGDGDLR